MRILILHNRYQQRGGEDVVFETETSLLRRFGHQVETVEFTNDDIAGDRLPVDSIRLASSTVWSRASAERVKSIVACFRPDVAHIHNTFPVASPSVYAACRSQGAAVVQTLHNFRLICPSAVLYRDRHVCGDCLGRLAPWPGIRHGCYRGSRLQTAAVATMSTVHRLLNTWNRAIDQVVALTNFSRNLFIANGLAAHKVVVKPNFTWRSVVESPAAETAASPFLFVGRLTPEKGVPTLVRAWREQGITAELRIAGAGPLTEIVEEAAGQTATIRPLGRLTGTEISRQLTQARALVLPSEWYEGFPMTLVEAFSTGTPVIASRIGAMAELVDHGRTGLLFTPGDAANLATQVRWAQEHPAEMRRMGAAARQEYEARYTPERNHDMLIDIYHRAAEHAALAQRG